MKIGDIDDLRIMCNHIENRLMNLESLSFSFTGELRHRIEAQIIRIRGSLSVLKEVEQDAKAIIAVMSKV
jgi:hypothetical protein